jgi:hypothetical protein
MSSKWRLFTLVFAATFSCGLAIFFIYFGHATGLDFRVLWKAARLPTSEIYRPDWHSPFVYPPSAIVWLLPLALFPFWTAYVLWTVFSLACFWRAAKSSALVFLSPAIVQCIILGQTSLVIASLLLAFPQGFAMGAMFGLICSIKPQIVFLAPLVFLARRDVEALSGFAAGFGVPVLLTTVILGPSIWIDWLNAMPGFRDTIVNRHLFWVFITPGGVAQSLGYPFVPAWMLGVLVALLAVFHSRPSDDRILIVGSSLLAAPYAAAQDMAALIPFALAASNRLFPALTFAGFLPPFSIAGWLASSGFMRDRSEPSVRISSAAIESPYPRGSDPRPSQAGTRLR